MLVILIFNILLLNIFKCEKIELEEFQLESNHLYSLSKFTYNNYSRNGPIKQGFNFKLKGNLNLEEPIKNSKNSLIYFYFILSEPSLSIKNNEQFCQTGIIGNEATNHEKISFLKKYDIISQNNTNNNGMNNNISYLDTGINDEFYFNEIGVKQFYLYFCCLINKEDEAKIKKVETNLHLNGEINIFNTNTFESAENFYRTYLNILITCYYGAFSLYWLIKSLGNLSKLNITMTIFSIIIPFIILENIMTIEFYMQLSDVGEYNYPFKIMEVIFRFIKDIGIKIVYFFIANGLQTLNKFPNKKDTQEFLVLLLIFIFSYTSYEASLIKYESDFILHPLVFLIITTFIYICINVYIWFIYMYKRIRIYEKNFRDKKFIKNAKILSQYSFSLFACFVAFITYVAIFAITIILENSFNKVYFKWIGDLANKLMSIFFFTTLCINLWEERQLLNFSYSYEAEMSDSNSNKSGNQNIDVFKKNNNEKHEKKDINLAKNEEIKAKGAFDVQIKN